MTARQWRRRNEHEERKESRRDTSQSREAKPPKTKPAPADALVEKLDRYQAALAKWLRKDKLARTYIRKYQQRLHRLEAKAAAMNNVGRAVGVTCLQV